MTLSSLNEMSNAVARKFDSARRRWWLGASSRLLTHTRRFVGCALPQACALCTARCGDAILCDPCMNALPALGPACPVCARPAPGAAVCGACLRHPPRFAATIAARAYAFPLDRLVQALKYEHCLALAEPLGEALAVAVQRAPATYHRASALVALPLAPTRQRQRGFNQATEIARVVARCTGLPLTPGLVRTGNGPAQATLPWAQRRSNVRGAFACNASFRGTHVALVDDVMTTGATLEAAAMALLRAGAVRVDAWVVARTLPPGEEPVPSR